MPMKPLLGAFALMVAVAGCAPLPATPGTDSALRAPASASPAITLRTQGLLKAALGDASVTLTPTGAVVTTDVVIRNAKDEPLSGLKRENFVMGLSITMASGTLTSEDFDMTLDVTEPQAGTYRLVSTLEGAFDDPTAFALELAIRNPPLIHDVAYEFEDEED